MRTRFIKFSTHKKEKVLSCYNDVMCVECDLLPIPFSIKGSKDTNWIWRFWVCELCLQEKFPRPRPGQWGLFNLLCKGFFLYYYYLLLPARKRERLYSFVWFLILFHHADWIYPESRGISFRNRLKSIVREKNLICIIYTTSLVFLLTSCRMYVYIYVWAIGKGNFELYSTEIKPNKCSNVEWRFF
jgi:hypothetical protein